MVNPHPSGPSFRSNYGPLYKFRILLIFILGNLLAVKPVQGQYLLNSFKPKIKSSPHNANHIIQDDGKIVLLGDYAFAGDAPVPNLVRLNSDGSLDEEFLLSEELRNQFTSDFGQCCLRATVVQGPGNDLVLMQAQGRRRITIIDGSGKFKSDIQTPEGYLAIERLMRHKDGYIAVAHKTGTSESIFRLDKEGRVDAGFTRIDFDGYAEDIVVDPGNSNVFLVGRFMIAGVTHNIIKVNESGKLDTTFGNVAIDINFGEIHLFPDGRIVVSSGIDLLMLDATGHKIGTFNPQTDSKQIYSTVIDPVNNRIIIVLDQYPQPTAVIALNLDGSKSSQFTPIIIGSANALARISPKGDQFVLTTGDEIQHGSSFHSFLQFSGSGTVDSNISTKEKLFNVGYVNDAVELEDASLIVGGSFTHIGNTQVNNLAKLDKAGNVDVSFTSNNSLSRRDVVQRIEKAANDKLYVGGFFHDILGTTTNSLIRIDTDGTLDASFVTHVASTASYTFLDDFIIMPDRIIACGTYPGNIVSFDFNGNSSPGFNTNIFGSQLVSVNSLCKVDDDNFAMGGHVLNGKGFVWVMDVNGNIDNTFVRQDEIPISADHMVKVGNEIYRAGFILGGQSSSDGNFIFKYNLQDGQTQPTKLATYTFSKNNHVLPLNDSTVVVSGRFNLFNSAALNNFAVSNYSGLPYQRLTFQVSGGKGDHEVSKTVHLSGNRILLLGHFDNINDEPFYSAAMINYTNYKPVVNLKDEYFIPEDTSFYLSGLIDITDMDDNPRYSAIQSDKFQLSENGYLTLKKDFNGSMELKFNVKDPLSSSGPFTTSLTIEPVNDPPVIKSQLEVPNIIPGENYEIESSVLDVIDVDGDDITLIVHAGRNYSLSGGISILPEAGFNGTLNVGVSASDGTLSSEVFAMTIISGHPLGIEETTEMAFYPNPISDYLKIASWENIERLSVLGASGQKLATYDQADLRQSSGVVQAGTLPKGMLVINVVLKTKEVLHVKVIKK